MRTLVQVVLLGLAASLMEPGAVAAQQQRPRPAAGAALGSGVMRMRLVKIMDTQGWGQPVEVARLLIPSDWKDEGGIQWAQNMARCPQNIIQARWRARSPDGGSGIEVLPQYGWVWSDDPMQQQMMQQSAANNMACDAYPVMSPADFLAQMVVPRTRQQARVIAAEPLPAVSRAEQEGLNRTYGPIVQQGYLRGVRAEAGRVRVQHTLNGQPVEEWITATIATIAAPSANSAALMNGGTAMTATNYQLMAYNVVGAWAPGGQLDRQAKLFATMFASTRPNPQYQAAVAQFLGTVGRIQQQAAMDRQRIWREAQQSISSSIQQTYAQNQAVQDRLAEQFGQTIRGVETYIDPRSNERVELVGGYTSAWSNGKGEYILSDTPGFNAATALQEDWREMHRPPR
ncbi:MAG: hypothetical protein IPI38_07470 [Gemmatimonadetes bacterium]|nr:hypothetical protein [Gemmatimonadota bacterium]